jgi:O-antigen/teichoic acid export membrane protein
MTRESAPLMLNHLLATIFFQIDVIIIEAIHGGRMVGQYGVAYKWVAALNIIPAFFTQALLPLMSRQARDDRPALERAVMFGLKLLFGLAVPVAVVFTFLAYFLTEVLGGREFLPDSAIATQLMIWSIPVGWLNSLMQYVLIALDLQRRITRAFVVAVSFNIITNLIFVPAYGYQAAAVTTILSELVLLVPFALLLRRAGLRLRWLTIVRGPLLAGAVMVVVMALLWPAAPLLALAVGGAVYLLVWWAARPFTADERTRLAGLLPGRLRRALRQA